MRFISISPRISSSLTAAALAMAAAVPAAHAQTPQPTPAQTRANYALPWTMRPAIAPTLARIESSVGARNDGVAAVTLLTVGAAILPTRLGVYVRWGAAHATLAPNHVPAGAATNPLLMALYTPELTRGLRLSAFAAVTIPVGAGGGNAPQALSASTIATGVPTRSAMDNALFAVNYCTPIAGLGVAWMRAGWTLQLEVTVLQLLRVRGENHRSATDAMRTNFTAGASVGYLLHRYVTASAELHYQRWLSAPNLLQPASGPAPSVDQASFELGVRGNLALSPTLLVRPGISFGMGFNGAMADREYKVVHFDLPLTF